MWNPFKRRPKPVDPYVEIPKLQNAIVPLLAQLDGISTLSTLERLVATIQGELVAQFRREGNDTYPVFLGATGRMHLRRKVVKLEDALALENIRYMPQIKQEIRVLVDYVRTSTKLALEEVPRYYRTAR